MQRRNLALLAGGLVVALLVVIGLAPTASSDPDGLQRVAADEGFSDDAQGAPFELLPGYSIPGVDNEAASTIFAGTIGTLAVAALALAAGWLLRQRARSRERERSARAGPPSTERA